MIKYAATHLKLHILKYLSHQIVCYHTNGVPIQENMLHYYEIKANHNLGHIKFDNIMLLRKEHIL